MQNQAIFVIFRFPDTVYSSAVLYEVYDTFIFFIFNMLLRAIDDLYLRRR